MCIEAKEPPLVPAWRIAEIGKNLLKWTPYPPRYTPELWEVMDAMSIVLKEAEEEIKRRESCV